MLLDCTLRDGGFINNWEFEYSSIRSIVSRLVSAGVEIIEVGYMRKDCVYDPNRTVFPSFESISNTFTGINHASAMLVVMIDFGNFPAEDIPPCSTSVIKGIRVTFKKVESALGLEFCSVLKRKGYKVFINPISLTSYTDMEILKLIDKVNEVSPFALSIVDTYGVMLREEILHYIDIIDNNLGADIILGYHSHNNQQMAYANCCSILERRNRHGTIIDTSLFGIGKSAGNANIELVASYENKVHCGKYKIDQLLDCIYTDILRFYKVSPWGYNVHHYLSAINDCHHDYINFLLKKNTLSVKSINEIVALIPKENRLSYSLPIIENLYIMHQSVSINDDAVYKNLKPAFTEKNILLLFPGYTLKTYEKAVSEYIAYRCPLIISVNFIPPHISPDYVFTGNRKRYDQLSDNYFLMSPTPCVIATSNILESNVPVSYRLNYETLIEPDLKIPDNGGLLCLNFLYKLGVTSVAIAGMDGFSADEGKNYMDSSMIMYGAGDNLLQVSSEMKNYIASMRKRIKLNFITPTIYA